jgi:tetratricopeptide (TPR) repeat protein
MFAAPLPPPKPTEFESVTSRSKLRWAYGFVVVLLVALFATLYGLSERAEPPVVATNSGAPVIEDKGKATEAARLAKERRKSTQAARLVEEQRKVAEATRAAEEQRKSAEAARLAEQQRKAAEAGRLAEQRKSAEVARLVQQQRKAEQARPVRIQSLLAAAEADFAALRLTSPQGTNAVEKYREVLTLDADNAQARAGLVTVLERYIALANEASAKGSFDTATAYLERAKSVLPDAESVQITHDAIERENAVRRVAKRESAAVAERAQAPSNSLDGIWIGERLYATSGIEQNAPQCETYPLRVVIDNGKIALQFEYIKSMGGFGGNITERFVAPMRGTVGEAKNVRFEDVAGPIPLLKFRGVARGGKITGTWAQSDGFCAGAWYLNRDR